MASMDSTIAADSYIVQCCNNLRTHEHKRARAMRTDASASNVMTTPIMYVTYRGHNYVLAMD